MIRIIRNEWSSWWRTGQLRWLIVFVVILLVLVAYFGAVEVLNRQELVSESRKEVRDQWENMGPSNPHGAAHYGSYAFKPISPLTALDEGVNLTAGRVLRLEGHVQNETVHSSQSQSAFISYFGPLKASLILQIMIPLLVIFLTYYSIQSEREQGRIRLILIQGLSYRQVILGKVVSVWILSIMVLFATLLVQWIVFGESITGDYLLRSALIVVSYSSFYFIIGASTAGFCSSVFKGSSALTVMLAVWVLWLIFLPKLSGWAVEERHPLPSRQEFSSAMREDRSKGIDGHNPTDEREKVLKDSVLLAYGVSSVDSLPINYDGIVMQADEDYGSIVWDKHFGSLFDVMRKQKEAMQYLGLVNPFSSLQSISMGVCGTDQWNHLHFQQEAEMYRRDFIRALNYEHAYGGSRTGDWGWEAEQEFFNSIDDFYYETPEYTAGASIYWLDWMSLLLWVIISVGFLRLSTTRDSAAL